ncbi:CLUMA_CG014752, isoform A [Clunio marinus]|uniref:CLUMA_CG014752, isoform A n=1 Tax=Clunio marinus TaxID=568069 RepID=A0A1J1IPW1_9DIPT|nr:CLUMA_CG014752, isoform A [Clunio marinus]
MLEKTKEEIEIKKKYNKRQDILKISETRAKKRKNGDEEKSLKENALTKQPDEASWNILKLTNLSPMSDLTRMRSDTFQSHFLIAWDVV